LSTSFVFAQAKKFDKKFGYFEYELVPSIQIVDSQNNHIVAGQFKGFHQVGNTTIQTRGDFDIFIIKYDVNNAIVWVKTFGSSAEDNLASLSGAEGLIRTGRNKTPCWTDSISPVFEEPLT
jgi:hypothetical protein